MNYQKYQGAIFDCDGTLLDSMPMWRNYASNLVKHLGHEPEPGLDSYCNLMSLAEASSYMKIHYKLAETTAEIIALSYKLVENMYYQKLPLKPKALKLLNELKNLGYKMIIATATPKILVEGAIRRLGIRDFFVDIISVDDYNTNKSVPFIYDKACEILALKKKDVLVFEDALHAIKTCVKADYTVIAIEDKDSENEKNEISALATEVISLYR